MVLPACGFQRYRKFWAGAALACYLLSLFGYPVFSSADSAVFLASADSPPADRTTAKPGDPFPCQSRSCGCRSAKQCWDHCCCSSRDEQIAWYRQRGLKNPAEQSAEQLADAARPAPSVCEIEAGDGADRVQAVLKQRRCCQQRAAKPAPSRPATASPASETKIKWVLSMAQEKCQGKHSSGSVGGASLAPPARIVWMPEVVCLLAIAAESFTAVELCYPPSLPPPRAI